MHTVAIDARKYFDYGIGTYIQQLISHLSQLESPWNFHAYVSPGDARQMKLPSSWQQSVVRYGKYSVGEILFFGRQSKKDGATIFHSPHYTLPLGLGSRSVVTIHDLIPLKFPEYYNTFQRSYAHLLMSHAVRGAGSVLVDSEFTKNDILDTFRVNERRIVVAHLGVTDEFRPVMSKHKIAALRKKFDLPGPFILFVGNIKPHKGIAVLFKALALLKHPDVDLVFVGEKPFQNAALLGAANELHIEKRIHQIGRLSQGELVLAYNAAEVLAMPSLYEGFGLPVLEAMACGTPVVASDAGSLPEIVGNAALVIPRNNPGALAEALELVLRNSKVRKQLVEKGKNNVLRFSWRKTAEKTLEVYRKLI
jgi:glycosyltransferase involved in cell wall biosynthesis